MRRSQYLPRPLRPRYRAPLSVLVWVMLAVGWTLQGTTASAQPDPFHRSPTWVEFRAAFERLRLPGLEPFPEGLEARLWKAYQAKGPDYQPRTHHLDSKGVPLYINRLISEASPYLLQHAHNPVNWYSWGPEAFAAAQAESKVILVSIGYSTCYWCHVMEQDSYEDEALAEVLNRHFISIKVDREERPDVDKIHMDAVVAMRGQGGWPLNVFLTPDLKPFWGGTYFPRAQFLHILRQISTAWRKDPSKIERSVAARVPLRDKPAVAMRRAAPPEERTLEHPKKIRIAQKLHPQVAPSAPPPPKPQRRVAADTWLSPPESSPPVETGRVWRCMSN